MIRDTALLGTRLVLGGYLAVHGAQKLLGAFGGRGLEATGAGFDAIGLAPGKQMAVVAGVSELGGGLLTAAGIADPLGPLTLIGTMAVASATHRAKGPLAARGGFELPLTNLAAAAALAAAGPGRLSVGPRLPRPLTAAAAAVGAALAAGSLARLLSARPAAADELRSAAADEPARAGAGTAVPEAAGTGEER
ncbi:MAG: DoxX family protein [Streptosporangiaceae bacterium]|jgi:putative oxidoreductase